MSDVEQKLNKLIQDKLDEIKKWGSAKISTCDHFNWDRDVWAYRFQIMEAFRSAGYDVNSSTNHGVLDIYITKPTVFEIQRKAQELSDMDNISREDYGINPSY